MDMSLSDVSNAVRDAVNGLNVAQPVVQPMMYMYPQEIYMDHVIIDDGCGCYYSAPYTMDAQGVVTLSPQTDWTEVEETWQPVGAFKALGEDGWEGIFSNIFWDREVSHESPNGERFPLEGLKEFASWVNEDPSHLPVLELFHLPNVVIGQAKSIEVIGPYIYASGEWGQDAMSQAAKEYFNSDKANELDWAMSHHFKYWTSDYEDGEIRRFRSDELSVLPVKWAANVSTQFKEKQDMATRSKSLREDLVTALQSVIGLGADAASKAADEGLAQKQKMTLDKDEVVGEKASPIVVAVAPDDEDTEEDDDMVEVPEDAVVLALTNALARADASEAKQTELAAQVKQLADAVKALSEEATARKQLLPKAVAAALEARSKSAPGISTETVKADVASQQAGLTGQKDVKDDPLGWFAEKAGLPFG
jgi:hypothetical protein